MAAVKSAGVLEYHSIDDILGPGSGRFFSAGYKRVDRHLGDITVVTDRRDRAELTATARLSYPADWSKKSPDTSLRPHLSSVDAMFFGVVLGEMLLSHRHALDAGHRRRMWLRAINIRAGSTPMEELTAFPVSAAAGRPRPAPGSPTWHTTTVECQIGTIKVRCDIDHEAPVERAATGHYATPADLIGPDATRYYGDGFVNRDHAVENLGFAGRGRITADVSILPGPREELPTEGLGGQYQPSITAMDCMVTMAQVNQALLYLQDTVARGESNTLWLRRFALEARRPDQPFDGPFPVSAHTVHSDLIQHAGGTWRTSALTGEFPGFSGRTLLAHHLPSTDVRGE